MTLVRRYPWVWVALLVLSLHTGAVQGVFHYDDDHGIVRNTAIRDLSNLAVFFVDPGLFSVDPERSMYRPLLLVSYTLNYAVTGAGPAGFLAVNVLLHAINAGLVTWIARCWMPWSVAAFGGLLFGLHPLGTEPVNYVSARSDSLVALGLLLAVGLALRAARRSGATWPPAVAAGLALLSKSTAIGVAPMMVLAEWWQVPGRRVREVLIRHRAVVLLSLFYLGIIWVNGFLPRSLHSAATPVAGRLLTQLKAPAHYLYTLAMPISLSPEPAFVAATGPSAAVLAAAVFLGSVALVCHRLAGAGLRQPLALGLWFLCTLLPVSLAPLNVLVNDRRLYLPLAGLALVLAGILLTRRGRGRGPLAAAAVVVLAALSLQRGQVWRTEVGLWQDAVARAPQMPRAQLYLGDAYREAAEKAPGGGAAWGEAARAAYGRVIALAPAQQWLTLQAGNGLALLDLAQGRTGAARQRLEELIARHPAYTDALINLGNAYYQAARAGDSTALPAAIGAYRRAIRQRPQRHEPYLNLGAALHLAGHLDAAQKAYEDALERAPAQETAAFNLGALYMTRARAEATAAARRAWWHRAATQFERAAHLGHPSAAQGLRAVSD